jgi:hypothetical protein
VVLVLEQWICKLCVVTHWWELKAISIPKGKTEERGRERERERERYYRPVAEKILIPVGCLE